MKINNGQGKETKKSGHMMPQLVINEQKAQKAPFAPPQKTAAEQTPPAQKTAAVRQRKRTAKAAPESGKTAETGGQGGGNAAEGRKAEREEPEDQVPRRRGRDRQEHDRL